MDWELIDKFCLVLDEMKYRLPARYKAIRPITQTMQDILISMPEDKFRAERLISVLKIELGAILDVEHTDSSVYSQGYDDGFEAGYDKALLVKETVAKKSKIRNIDIA